MNTNLRDIWNKYLPLGYLEAPVQVDNGLPLYEKGPSVLMCLTVVEYKQQVH